MPDPVTIQTLARERFRESLGAPDRIAEDENEMHWSLRPLTYVAAINVLLNGGRDYPLVWIFDPHDPNDGVFHQRIRSEAEIQPILDLIIHKVRRAGRGGES